MTLVSGVAVSVPQEAQANVVQPTAVSPAAISPTAVTVAASIPRDGNGWPLHWWDCKLGQYWNSPVAHQYVACLPGIPQWEWATIQADRFVVRAWWMSRSWHPYVPYAAGPYAFDCSGFTKWSAAPWRNLPHSAAMQYYAYRGAFNANPVLRRGDLVMYNLGQGQWREHVAIYMGGGWIVNATGSHVQVNKLNYPGGGWARISGFMRPITN